MVRDDLRDGLLLPPPPVRAGRADRGPGRDRCGRPGRTRDRRSWPASKRRSVAGQRRAPDRPEPDPMTTILRSPRDWPAILLPRDGGADPARPGRRARGRRVRRPPPGAPRPRPDGHDRDRLLVGPARPRRRRLPDRREVARGRGGGRAAAGATSSRTATAPTRRRSTDRTLLERNPYAVLEGALIAAAAIGAGEAIIAVRAEATDAIRALETALDRMLDANLAGDDILGSGRSVEVSIRTVQGAYMLGEETVLLKALEGKRGQPEQRPPHPTTRGLVRPAHASSRTSRPSPRSRGSSPTARRRSPRSARRPAPARSSSRSGRPHGAGVAEVPIGTTLRDIVALAGPRAVRHELEGAPRRRAVGRNPAGRAGRHRLRVRRPPRGRRPRRLRARSWPPTSAPASSIWPAS